MKYFYSILLIILSLSSCIFCQVIDSPRGKIEFIGLQKWNAKQLYDSIQALEPGKPFHACAGTIRSKLSFPSAAVVGSFENNNMYTVVTVVEPQFKERIKNTSIPSKTFPLNEKWKAISKLYESNTDEFQIALQTYFLVNPAIYDTVSSQLKPYGDPAIIKEIWRTLAGYNSSDHLLLANKTLATDANEKNRIFALMTLSNFGNIDSTWWKLAEALRYPNDLIAGISGQILNGLTNKNDIKINWTPAVPTLRPLIDGTNLFEFVNTLTFLTKTKVSNELAAPLLKNGGDLVIAYLKANRSKERDIAYYFLKQISGKDFGCDPLAWADWIRSL